MTEPASKLAHAIAQGVSQHTQHHAEQGAQRRKAELHDLAEEWERELATVFREKGLIDFNDPDLPEEIRRVWSSLDNPTHQADFIFNLLALIGVGLSGAFAAAAGTNQRLTNMGLKRDGFTFPEPNETAAMYVRGWIDDSRFNDYMQNKGVKDPVGSDMVELAYAQLPPSVVIDLTLRRKITVDRAREILHRNGYEEIAVEELLTGLLHPPPVSTIVNARVQNQLTEGDYIQLLEMSGIDPQYAKVIYETEGATMPPQMANELFRRGFIDQALYEQMLIESNLKNKYVPYMKDLRWRVPPMRQITAAYKNGSIERGYAEESLAKLGFNDIDQKWMLDSAGKTGSAATHHLTMQQSVALYEGQIWTRDQARASILAIGWDEGTADAELDLADHRRSVARQSRAANAVGARYVSWKISRADASMALDALNLPAPARDEALEAWDIERDERMHHPSLADMKAMHKRGWMTQAEVRQELLTSGYRPDLAERYIQTFFPEGAATTHAERDLSRADHLKRYAQGTITRDQLKAAMMALGYDATEAEQIAEIADGGKKAAT